MDFTQAKQAIAGFQRFFRALGALDEVLDTAIEAKNQSNQTSQQITNAQEELKGITNKIADLQPKLTNLKDQYDAKMAEMKDKVAAKEGALLDELNKQIAIAKDDLSTIESEISVVTKRHEGLLVEYQKQQTDAKKGAEFWESKLAEAKSAFEKFKQGL